MTAKFTTEQFIEKSNIIHNNKYDYSKSKYINNHSVLEIICPVHKSFWQKPLNHYNGSGCKNCAYYLKSKTTELFIEKSNQKHNFKYDYSKTVYINKSKKIIIICPIHGEILQSPMSHLNGYGCQGCGKQITINKKSIKSEDFFKRALKIHKNKYDYSLCKFISSKEDVIIICKIHGQFLQQAGKHYKGQGCCRCKISKKRMSIQQVIDKANKIHNYQYDYSKFINYQDNKRKIIIVCKMHGDFSKKIDSHLQGVGCLKCSREKLLKKSLDNFIEKAQAIHNNKYDYSNVTAYNSIYKINIICSKHGSFKQIGYQHLLGHNCPACTKENRRLTLEDFLIQARNVHNDKYDYSEVELNLVSNKVKILCFKHGPFWQRPATHLYKKGGCSNCSKIISKAEVEWLDYLKIPNEFRNKKLQIQDKYFYPDGYNPATNTIYEYNGDYWHGNPKIYDSNKINKLNKTKFGDLYKKTIDRENFIKSNGYNLITIWENEWETLKKSL